MTLTIPGSVTSSRRGARGPTGIPGPAGSAGSGGGADLTLVPTLAELPAISQTYDGAELTVEQRFWLGPAHFPCRVASFAITATSQAVDQSADDVNYWTVALVKSDSVTGDDTEIVSWDTALTDGFALVLGAALFWDVVVLGSEAQLFPGDGLSVIWTPAGSPVSSPGGLNHSVRLEPV